MKWISVEYSLPEQWKHVLIFSKYEEQLIHVGFLDDRDLWFTSTWQSLIKHKVTHWMELPSAPSHESMPQESKSPEEET